MARRGRRQRQCRESKGYTEQCDEASNSGVRSIQNGSQAPNLHTYETDVEFVKLLALDGIPEDLRKRMFAVAPMLRGRVGTYKKEFFVNVVGLCGKGYTLDELQRRAVVTDAEIFAVWSRGRLKNRFEIAKCTDPKLAQRFTKHHFSVYGTRPVNRYFSMRFLRGCHATFLHGCDVDWAAEASLRRTQRLQRKTRTPEKLEPSN